jgi:hypothetical protein
LLFFHAIDTTVNGAPYKGLSALMATHTNTPDSG